MERLTVKWKPECYDTFDPIDIVDNDYSKMNYEKLLVKLGEYEDAEEQGLLLRLPCKVGDTVYFPKYDYHDSAIITQIEIDKQGIIFYWAQYEYGVDVTELWDDGYFSIDDIGKTVFLTKEEAEQLKAGGKNE